MQTNARWQAILELIEQIWQDQKPADNIINEYFRARRYIGSKDRRFITDHIWQIIRNRCKLEFDINNCIDASLRGGTEAIQSNNKSKIYRHILIAYLKDEAQTIFTGDQYAPAQLTSDEKNLLKKLTIDETPYPAHTEAETPLWIYEKINNDTLCRSLNSTAPADFRINVKHRSSEIDNLTNEGLTFTPTPYSPIGIRSQERVNLNNCIAHKEGEIEVQDEASQIASILADPKPAEKIIDYCCGAGGKSLTMSYLMNNQGKIQAHDINWHRLEAIKDRADRLKATNIEIIKELEDKDYDLFLLDAPCSGSGTWRRSPDAKFRLTKIQLTLLNKTQKELLNFAANHIKKGGRIVYITCSILQEENEERIQEFLKNNTKFKPINIKQIWNQKIDSSSNSTYPHTDEYCLKISPQTTNTDGFFICILQKQ